LAQKEDVKGIQYSLSGLSVEFVCCVAAYIDSPENLVRNLYGICTKFDVMFSTSDYRVDEWDVTFEISTADILRCKLYPISCEFLQTRLER